MNAIKLALAAALLLVYAAHTAPYPGGGDNHEQV
jgi:hypothetical protein